MVSTVDKLKKRFHWNVENTNSYNYNQTFTTELDFSI